MILNPRATREQKTAAVGKVAEVTAEETAKTTIRRVATPARIERTKAAIKSTAKKAAPLALPVAGAIAVGTARVKLQGKVAKRTLARSKTPEAKALRALDDVERNLKRKLTPKERRTLYAQHVEHFKRNP